MLVKKNIYLYFKNQFLPFLVAKICFYRMVFTTVFSTYGKNLPTLQSTVQIYMIMRENTYYNYHFCLYTELQINSNLLRCLLITKPLKSQLESLFILKILYRYLFMQYNSSSNFPP